MSEGGQPSFRIAGEAGREAVEKVRARLAERVARGILDHAEIARVTAAPLRTFVGDETTSEFFRRCCVTWEVDRVPPITSHRGLVGVPLVAGKRLLRWCLRFLNEQQLSRQRDFNWNLLLAVRELLEARAGDPRPDTTARGSGTRDRA
jgi:hypothetical protein